MTAVFCANAADRKGETWEQRLAPFDRLEFVVSDSAKGIAKAVARVARSRRDAAPAPALEHGLDVFHTAMEARRVLARHRRRAESAWEQAEAADVEVTDAKRRGVDARRRPGRPRRLGQGHRVHRADRAPGVGLGSLPSRPGVVPPRWPSQRPRRLRGDRRGAEGPHRLRLDPEPGMAIHPTSEAVYKQGADRPR